jgi:hypothetical protein
MLRDSQNNLNIRPSPAAMQFNMLVDLENSERERTQDPKNEYFLNQSIGNLDNLNI